MADVPASPTPSDRRIIFAKLEEIYIDEVKGYSGNWTDEKVSRDLGVPRAWVSEVREINFGPIRDNEQTRELILKIDAVSAEFAAETKKVDDITTRINSDLRLLQQSQGSISELRARVRELERTARALQS